MRTKSPRNGRQGWLAGYAWASQVIAHCRACGRPSVDPVAETILTPIRLQTPGCWLAGSGVGAPALAAQVLPCLLSQGLTGWAPSVVSAITACCSQPWVRQSGTNTGKKMITSILRQPWMSPLRKISDAKSHYDRCSGEML